TKLSAGGLGEPAEWCAKVTTAGTGTFESNGCTGAAGTKEFIKVMTFKRWWEVCKEVAGVGSEPPVKYDEHKCNTQLKPVAERKWQWKKLEAGESEKVV